MNDCYWLFGSKQPITMSAPVTSRKIIPVNAKFQRNTITPAKEKVPLWSVWTIGEGAFSFFLFEKKQNTCCDAAKDHAQADHRK